MLSIGSLFSGIGGLELGLEWAGLGPVLWQCENDPFCHKILARHWPDAERYPDVRTLPTVHAIECDLNGYCDCGAVPRPGIVAGGFPCQGISDAGKRVGLEDPRSGLWREFARVVRDVRPRFVVIENVAPLVRRGLGDVLGDLAASGYDAIWDCIPAAALGAPHGRDRIFVIGALADSEYPGLGERWPSHDDHGGDAQRDNADRRNAKPAFPPGPDDLQAWQAMPNALPGICRKATRIPHRVDRVRVLGNSVVPAVAEVLGWAIREMIGA
jgi:DNA (cytosine-5)-methyltransferase 1